MSRRKRVSEKTLELNLCAEILTGIRSLPACGEAFWIGMKQHQEARHGMDEILSNMPSAYHLALQFKAPRASRPDQVPYRYSLNERQHERLLALSRGRPHAVWYVLPNYNTFTRVRNDAPVLTSHSYLLQTAGVGPLTGSRSGRHRVDSYEAPPRARVHSPVSAELTSLKSSLASDGFLGRLLEGRGNELLASEELAAWLSELEFEADGNRFRVGQWLRGFGTVCMP